METFFKRFLNTLSFTYYIDILLYVIVLYCLISIAWSRKNTSLKRYCMVYIFSIGLLFFSVDFLFSFKIYLRAFSGNEKHLTISELLNMVFGFVETFIFYKILNYNIKSKLLERLSVASLSLLTIVAIWLIPSVIHEKKYTGILSQADLYATTSYALLTIGLTAYHYESFKLNINWTYTTPLIFAMFCYVLISLLLFPCYSFLVQHFIDSSIPRIFRIYHISLICGVCLCMNFTITKREEKANEFITFEI
jgi:hypothetical protein